MENKLKKRGVYAPIVPMGYYKSLYLASVGYKKKKVNGLSVFVKNEGDFKNCPINSTFEAADVSTAIVTFEFKDKKSINRMIEILEFYRDNEFGKIPKDIVDMHNLKEGK